MYLSSINLRNIRKHTDTKIDFAKKLNYIVGGNGVGKTTVLEAIYYLCTTKSCVTSSDAEAVKLGENGLSIQGYFTEATDNFVQINYSLTENKKAYRLSDKQIFKFSDVIGKFPVVLLSPADHSITQGFPAERRKFVDSVISQSSKTYLANLIEYNKTLKHRTYLLNRLRESNKKENRELEAWNEKLVISGAEIIEHRKNFVSEFEPYISSSYYEILSNREKPKIKYYYLDGNCSGNLSECFERRLEMLAEDEIRRGTNLVGPHRDDFIFEIDGLKLKHYGSQGQHKTFQTMLRFAEYFYLKDKTGTSPIFLLDDVFGELDAERAASISKHLSTVGQALITLTDFGNISHLKVGEEDRVIKISMDGSITYE